MYNTYMKKTKLRNILSDEGYSNDTINSIMIGRRKPNSDLRYKFEKDHGIPFTAWNDIKSFLHDNDTKVSGNK